MNDLSLGTIFGGMKSSSAGDDIRLLMGATANGTAVVMLRYRSKETYEKKPRYLVSK